MPGKVNLKRPELVELIKQKEEAGGDAAELKRLLDEVDRAADTELKNRRPPDIRGEADTPAGDVEIRYVLGLFTGDITGEMITDLVEYNRKYSGPQLQRMCQEAGLSATGKKMILAARLITSEQKI